MLVIINMVRIQKLKLLNNFQSNSQDTINAVSIDLRQRLFVINVDYKPIYFCNYNFFSVF